MTTKEKPIIFSGPSIPSIQNLKPDVWPAEPIDPGKPWKWQTRRLVTAPWHKDKRSGKLLYQDKYGERHPMEEICPYPPGTRLWVRETFAHAFADTTVCGSTYTLQYQYIYKADNPELNVKWRPSIHMPREAARLFLEVKSARVERLRDITEEGARAEGIRAYGPNNCSGTSARITFAELWDSTNGKEYPWENNPWVWVYEFMRIVKFDEQLYNVI